MHFFEKLTLILQFLLYEYIIKFINCTCEDNPQRLPEINKIENKLTNKQTAQKPWLIWDELSCMHPSHEWKHRVFHQTCDQFTAQTSETFQLLTWLMSMAAKRTNNFHFLLNASESNLLNLSRWRWYWISSWEDCDLSLCRSV